MDTLTSSMPFFTHLLTSLQDKPNSMSAADAKALVEQVVRIANFSPTLASEIVKFQDTAGSTLNVGSSGAGNNEHTGDFVGGPPPTINLPIISDFAPNGVGATFASTSTPQQAPLSQAGQFVGDLAHELGHYMDAEQSKAGALSRMVDIDQGFAAGISLLSEGKATANAVKVAQEVASAPGSTAADHTKIPLGSVNAAEMALLKQNPDPLAPAALGNFATYFSGLDTSTSGSPNYVQFYLKGYGGAKDPSLSLNGTDTSTVTQEQVTAAPDGTLKSLLLTRTGANGSPAKTLYDFPGLQRVDYDAANQAIDSDKENADGSSQLTTYFSSNSNYSSLFWTKPNGTGAISSVSMAGTGAVATLDPAALNGAIFGFAPTDTLDLTGIGAATTAILGAGDVLAVQDGSRTVSLKLNPAQSFADTAFSVTSDGKGGTDVTAAPASAAQMLSVVDTTSGQPMSAAAQAYAGPVSGLQEQYVNITPDSLSLAVSTPNWFIHSGGGNDALSASSGTNVLDGGAGSNFLAGGSGTDTFFVDDRGAKADAWSTVSNFHAGDAATVWGVGPGAGLTWVDGQGAAGHTGLTLHAAGAGGPTASLTLAGFTQADLASRLSVSFGTDSASSSNYMSIRANG